MAVETIANIYRGTLAKIGAIDMKLVPVNHSIISGFSYMNDEPNEYIVGAEAEDTDNARSTTRIFPNTPVGARIAETRPPRLFPLSKPECHDCTAGAAAVNAAPKIWPVICMQTD
jgi:hypothetical protein